MANRRARPPGSRTAVARAAALLGVLSNEVRLAVVVALDERGAMSAGALQALVGVEQSALSHQLAVLRGARLVAADRRGRHMIYRLVDHHVGHIVRDAIVHAGEQGPGGRSRA